MKKILLLFLATTLMVSCSSDSDDAGEMDNMDQTGNEITESDLVGTWVLTDLRFDETADNDDLDFAKEILMELQAIDCEAASFTFNADNTVVSESKLNFLANSISVGAGGLVITCPDESDIEETTWSLESNQLTFVNEGADDETITIVFEDENTLIIAGEDIDENNYAGAEAVFTRQQ